MDCRVSYWCTQWEPAIPVHTVYMAFFKYSNKILWTEAAKSEFVAALLALAAEHQVCVESCPHADR